MLVQPFSDIHSYDLSFRPKKTNADLLICAGDWDMGLNTSSWNDKVIRAQEKEMIKVPGNHDFWCTSATGNKTVEQWVAYYKSLENKNISYLINETKIIDGIAFIGSTLWSDFKKDDLIVKMDSKISKDYEKIYTGENQLIESHDIYEKHIEARNFIIGELEKHSDKKCVVITHFPPSISCNISHRITHVSYYWTGQMEDIISMFQPVLWISGHMHNFFDKMMGDTRVIINPAGKVVNGVAQREDFVTDLVIKV